MAQLQWESYELQLRPSIGQEQVSGEFKFQNTGTTEITIVSTASSCGCTTASLKRKVIAPGEKGEISIAFTVGSRSGLQEKRIIVDSTDTRSPRTILTVKVDIPQIIQVTPTFLYWSPEEALSAKIIAVKILNDAPVHKISVASSDQRISTRVEEKSSGKDYEVFIDPKDVNEPLSAVLKIKADYPLKKPKEHLVSIRIK